jgi:hypothetical protein
MAIGDSCCLLDQLTLKDYNGMEKIQPTCPRGCQPRGAADGADPSVGDIAYYAPWAISRSSIRTSRIREALVKPGRIDAGADAFGRAETLRVKISTSRGICLAAKAS